MRRSGTLVLGFLVWTGCGAGVPDASQRPEPPRRTNVLLVSLDACRADHLSQDGYARPTSPFLDELAARGVRFPNAFVNTHGTTPSHATLLTSLYQETHRVEHAARRGEVPLDAIPSQARQLQEILQEAGYLTLAVTEGGRMSHKFGFDRGFDVYDDDARSIEEGTRRLAQLIREAVAQQRPVFAFLHTYQTHVPYEPPSAYRELFGEFRGEIGGSAKELLPYENDASALGPATLAFLEAQYDRDIRYTDDTLRAFFDELGRLGFLADYLAVVTADHGEEFGEHGGLLHRDHLYEELLRVPLIVAGTGVGPPGRVEERLASSIDVAPTILAQVGIAQPAWMEGRPLFGDGASRGDAVFAQYRSWRYAVRTRRWKLIENADAGSVELYDLVADPGEQHDRIGAEPARAARLRALLADWRRARPQLGSGALKQAQLAGEERERLEALGYVEAE